MPKTWNKRTSNCGIDKITGRIKVDINGILYEELYGIY